MCVHSRMHVWKYFLYLQCIFRILAVRQKICIKIGMQYTFILVHLWRSIRPCRADNDMVINKLTWHYHVSDILPQGLTQKAAGDHHNDFTHNHTFIRAYVRVKYAREGGGRSRSPERSRSKSRNRSRSRSADSRGRRGGGRSASRSPRRD